MLAEYKTTGEVFAVKIMKKSFLMQEENSKNAMAEKRVLTLGAKHPFLCSLHSAFQTEVSVTFNISELLNSISRSETIEVETFFPKIETSREKLQRTSCELKTDPSKDMEVYQSVSIP